MSTTCIGFGAHYNEDLLEAMARAGGGNYWYVEQHDQMAEIFAGEIEGLVALAAQNVTVEVRLSDPRVAGVSFLQSYSVEKTAEGGWRVRLHDLYATSPKALGLVLHVEDVRELGKVKLGEVRVEADVVTETGIEHRTTVMPVLANLDGEDHVEEDVLEGYEVSEQTQAPLRQLGGRGVLRGVGGTASRRRARTRGFAAPAFAGCAFVERDGTSEIGSGTVAGNQYLSAGDPRPSPRAPVSYRSQRPNSALQLIQPSPRRLVGELQIASPLLARSHRAPRFRAPAGTLLELLAGRWRQERPVSCRRISRSPTSACASGGIAAPCASGSSGVSFPGPTVCRAASGASLRPRSRRSRPMHAGAEG